MDKNELISCFRDTMNIAYAPVLYHHTENARMSNRVYGERFLSNRRPANMSAEIVVEENTTFAAAKKYRMFGRTAVLNFANPETPGGGVQLGAMAQEECLCRSSNLFACLNDASVAEDYYVYHQKLRNFFYTDRLIYTQNVTVFKDDRELPMLLPQEEWFAVDVITCAAPYLAGRKYTNKAALKEVLKSRIKNIFEAALDNGVEVLILGAFGCGAFKNPPKIVAQAFHEVIGENAYDKAFRRIIFAIKRSVDGVCPNLMAFEVELQGAASEFGAGGFGASFSQEQDLDEIPMPSGRILQAGEQAQSYHDWKSKNKYADKQFSILGDSLSTLDGYNPRGYQVFYEANNCTVSGVCEMKDTWWGQVIDYFGGELLVNNSWSGSRVTKLPGQPSLFPSGCSNERTSALHIDKIMPDVIIVYLGTNDWAFGAVRELNNVSRDEAADAEAFSYAYGAMLHKIRNNYPNSEVWCCTLNPTFISQNPTFVFPHEYRGVHIESYNEIIRRVAYQSGCKLIDLYRYQMPYDSIDGTHPNATGMKTLATLIIRNLARDAEECFLDCETEKHAYEVAGQMNGYAVQVCKKCGKEKCVVQNGDKIPKFYSDTIHLTYESTGNTVSIQKKNFVAGRHVSCGLVFSKEQRNIARMQATFSYENGMWFVKDNGSLNGTWLNNIRMLPNVYYPLEQNDVIDFARSERLVFDKAEAPAYQEESPVIAPMPIQQEPIASTAMPVREESPVVAPLPVQQELPVVTAMPVQEESPVVAPMPIQQEPIAVTAMPVREESPVVAPMPIQQEPIAVTAMPVQEESPVVAPMPIQQEPIAVTAMPVQEESPVVAPMPIQEEIPTATSSPIQQVSMPQAEEKSSPVIAGKYRVLNLLAQWGCIKMYLAQDVRDNKEWLLKVCDKTEMSYSVAMYERVAQEAQMMMNLHHSAIPEVVDIVDNEQYLCVVREHVKGETLESLVNRQGPQSPEMVVNWGLQLCDVLQYLHTSEPSYVYRDMKPANIMLTPDGRVKLIDFELMRQYDLLKEKPDYLGTKGYAAPEQYGGRGAMDARTDIYGMGMTMFRLVTGVNPCEPSFKLVPIRKIDPSLPGLLEIVIRKCTEFTPECRYQSCEILMYDLKGACR